MAQHLGEPIMMTMEEPIMTVREPVICGGYSKDLEATPEVQEKASAVKDEILKGAGAGVKADEFVVEKYASQLVNGINHKMKIRLAPGSYIHATVYEPFGAKVEDLRVHEVTTNHKKDEPLFSWAR
ncbi:hypothetical protein RvY_00170 [Ramazzottius varieornatus]|uniref:Cystatin domain-containing protein n=1 Tax=Ramazzottius varieornatus TaxID=947166 RepID=A0A1D1UCS4_RAMVA|nr:hypothetical protein RvY_00170 [Ramazzottius varieornatus]